MSRLKRIASRVPGVIVLHGLAKNARHMVAPRLATRGGISHGSLGVTEAVAYVSSIFTKIDAFVEGHGGWRGKRVLEVGPGDSLGTGLLALARGAESYCAIDGFRVRFATGFEAEVFARLRGKLSAEEARRVEDVLPCGGTTDPAARRRFAYVNDLPLERAAERLGGGTFDVVFSNAVLEHVADPAAAARSLSELLAPGGVMFHDIDLRSHQTYETHPLQFLEFPGWLWHLMSSHCGQPNRARRDEWLEHFRSAGLEILAAEVTETFAEEMVAGAIDRLARPYRGASVAQMSPAVIVVTALKP